MFRKNHLTTNFTVTWKFLHELHHGEFSYANDFTETTRG